MKSVLISIQPKWCELIASGKKTVEVRKTRPKIATPFKCYIYQTKMKWMFNLLRKMGLDNLADRLIMGLGKVIGEFVCDKIYDISPHFDKPDFCNQYICNWKWGEGTACMTFSEMDDYLKGKRGYGWHISNLVIYDKPKALSEFERVCPDNVYECAVCRHSDYTGTECTPITRPPQSWCYVEGE